MLRGGAGAGGLLIDRQMYGVAVKLAKRTKGIKKIDDLLEDTRSRT